MKSRATLALIALALFVAVWTALAAATREFHTSLPQLPQVWRGLLAMIHAGTYYHDVVVSLARFAMGFAIGAVLAIPSGIFTARAPRWLALAVESNFHVARAVPVIALVPLATFIFGASDLGKVCIVAWGSFFPIWLATHDAIRNIDETYILAARALGASPGRVLREVLVPHVAARIATGVRISLSIGLICVVAAEFAPSRDSDLSNPWHPFFSGGLGLRAARTADLYQVDRLVACVFTFGLLGICVDAAFARVLRVIPLVFGFDLMRGHVRGTSAA